MVTLRAPSPRCDGFSTCFASMIAPAQVPNVGRVRTNCFSFSNPCSPRTLRNVVDSPPGNHQRVDFVELLGLAHLNDLSAKLFEALPVRGEIALYGQNSYLHTSKINCVARGVNVRRHWGFTRVRL